MRRKIKFQINADSKKALEKAIKYVNLQSNADYTLISFQQHEVGVAIIEVTESKVKPEFLFMMGYRYKLSQGLEEKPKLNFKSD